MFVSHFLLLFPDGSHKENMTFEGNFFPTFPYQTWRTVYMRNKKLARLEG